MNFRGQNFFWCLSPQKFDRENSSEVRKTTRIAFLSENALGVHGNLSHNKISWLESTAFPGLSFMKKRYPIGKEITINLFAVIFHFMLLLSYKRDHGWGSEPSYQVCMVMGGN